MALNYSIYTSQPIPFAPSSPIPSSPDNHLWSPLSIVLIWTATAAVLIDTPATIAGTRDLADWISKTLPKNTVLKYFLPTHAHGDHILGLPVLLERFPHMKPYATAFINEGIGLQYAPEVYDAWKSFFPTTPEGYGLPDQNVTKYNTLPKSNTLDLDGHAIKVVNVAEGDTHFSSFIHVPDLDMVVAGDIVYNGDCHVYLAESNNSTLRGEWLHSLDEIAKLSPGVVVPGHTFKPPTSKCDKHAALESIENTKEYIHTFASQLSIAKNATDLFNQMRARYDRWNLWILNYSCGANFAH